MSIEGQDFTLSSLDQYSTFQSMNLKVHNDVVWGFLQYFLGMIYGGWG